MSSVNSDSDSVSTMSFDTVESTIKLPNGKPVTSCEMMEKLKAILPREDLKYNVTVFKNCFKANDAIEIFKTTFPVEIPTDQAAIAFGRMLQRARLMGHVCDPTKAFRNGHFFFRLQCYQQPEILNSYRICDEVCECESMDLFDLIATIVTQVEQQATDKHSRLVNYRVAHRSELYPSLEDIVCKLQGLDLGMLDEMTRFSAVVDLYNIMIKYAFMKVGVPDSNSVRIQFFANLKMNIGGDILSFNDLYHGILRANRPPYGSSQALFAAKDPRARLSLTKMDPRVHFCLNHAPTDNSTHIMNPKTINFDLQRKAKIYVANTTNLKIDTIRRTIHLSPIFKWYRSDFCNGHHATLLDFLQKNLVGQKAVDMQNFVNAKRAPKFSFDDFNWGLKAGNYFPFKAAVLKASEKRLL